MRKLQPLVLFWIPPPNFIRKIKISFYNQIKNRNQFYDFCAHFILHFYINVTFQFKSDKWNLLHTWWQVMSLVACFLKWGTHTNNTRWVLIKFSMYYTGIPHLTSVICSRMGDLSWKMTWVEFTHLQIYLSLG